MDCEVAGWQSLEGCDQQCRVWLEAYMKKKKTEKKKKNRGNTKVREERGGGTS